RCPNDTSANAYSMTVSASKSNVFVFVIIRPPPTSTLFPYTTLFRSDPADEASGTYQDELDEGLSEDLRRELQAVERAEQRLAARSEEHTSELQSLAYLVCRLLLEKKKKKNTQIYSTILKSSDIGIAH